MTATLVIHCGGTFIKATVLDEAGTMRVPAIQIPTPYPLTTELYINTLADLANQLPKADRVTVGLPGMIRHGVVWDTYVGETERKCLGNTFWSRRVKLMVETLRPMFVWDRVFIGGGNSRNIRPEILAGLGDDVIIVPNSAALLGGVRAWQLTPDGVV